MKRIIIFIVFLFMLSSSFAMNNDFYPIIVTSLVVKVSSKEVPAPLAKLAIENAVENSVVLKPGTLVKVNEQYVSDINLKESDQINLNVPVSILEDGVVKQQFSLSIKVKYQPIADNTAKIDKLFVSNNPEEVIHSGVLLRGTVSKKVISGLVLYHKNVSGKYQDILLTLTNHEDYDITVHLVAGFGGPSEDGLFVGHLATKRYFNYIKDKAGVYLTIPARTSRTIYRNPAKNNQVVSGIFKIRKMDEGKMTISTMMMDEDTSSIVQQIKHGKEAKGPVGGIFDGRERIINKSYLAGNDILNIRIGDEPFLRDSSGGYVLKGNYGLTYKLDLKLINNYRVKKKINLFFVPSGGIARGIFVVNDKIIETGLLNPIYWDDMTKIISVELRPYERKDLSLLTMPQPGSFYPVNIVVNTQE